MILPPDPSIPSACLVGSIPFLLPTVTLQEIGDSSLENRNGPHRKTNRYDIWVSPKAKYDLCSIIKTHRVSHSLFRASLLNINRQPRIFRYFKKVFNVKKQRHYPPSNKMKAGNKDNTETRRIKTNKQTNKHKIVISSE